MKPLLVGEAPGPNGDPEKPLDGRPSVRLLHCMGYRTEEAEPGFEPDRAAALLAEHFEIRNLLDRPMERKEGSKGTEWPKEEAAAAAFSLALLIERDQPLILLGKRVTAAFLLPDDWWSWKRLWAGGEKPSQLLHFATIPHPSGIVRTWNDPVNRVRAGMVLWQAVGKIPR